MGLSLSTPFLFFPINNFLVCQRMSCVPLFNLADFNSLDADTVAVKTPNLHNFYLLCCFVLCIFIITQIPYLSSVFFNFFKFIFDGVFTPSSHQHEQASHEKTHHAQQSHSCKILCDFFRILSAVFGTLVCVVDVPADAVANVAKFSLDVFHGLFPLSFNCLYYSMEIGICQLLFCTKELRFLFAELCILPKSADPPMPFIIFVPQILVLLTWP